MERRDFFKAAVLGVGALSASQLSAAKAIKWKMVTTWPKNFPALGTGAEKLAGLINEMSGGRIQVKVYAAGELVPPFEVFDAVSKGVAQMGHAASLYWRGKSPVTPFFSGVPFGMTSQEMTSWLYYGGGMDLWRDTYKAFGLVPAAAGNAGVQMAGWFNKPINSLADLKGLKMRIPGLGGEVLKRAGGTPVNIPGGEIFSSLKSGAIDATEWIGPYNDLAFGFHRAAKYYYYPGWHEPGTSLEVTINQDALAALPKDLQEIVQQACRVAADELTSEFTARNASALQILKDRHKVKIRSLPNSVLKELKSISSEVVQEMARKDNQIKAVYDSAQKFQQQAVSWHNISERAFLNARML